MKKRTVATTIESKRLLIIRNRTRELTRVWCESCHAKRYLLTVEHAALLSGLSHRQLFRAIEEGRIHFSEQAGRPLLCLESLCDMTPGVRDLFSTFRE